MGILCVAMVVASSGCAGCFREISKPTEPTGGTEPAEVPLPTNACTKGGCEAPNVMVASIIDCPTGSCDPENPNGQGIYTAEMSNYCFFAVEDQRFCPEAFVNVGGEVRLEFRDRERPRVIEARPLYATYKDSDNAAPQTAKLVSLKGDLTQLVLTYTLGNEQQQRTATGTELNKFTFTINSLEVGPGDAHPRYSYEMKLGPAPVEKSGQGVYRYAVRYRDLGDKTDGSKPEHWTWHCQDKAGPQLDTSIVSFLPRTRVSGLSAYLLHDDNTLTMGCETGAIVTCMNWGYTPWDPKTGQWDNNRDYVFRSCLQAKRAAYFAGAGDYKSYTLNGTKIHLRDQYGIRSEKLDFPEAIWSPEGAVCFNFENRRRKEPEVWGLQPDLHGLKPCTPLEWSLKGKLATGPAKLP